MTTSSTSESSSSDDTESQECECTICRGPFDLESEGGALGDIGILPVAFCPTCIVGVIEFAEYWIGMPGEEE